MMKNRARRRGMSYVEVLVIVAVVLTLGLLAIRLLGESQGKQADREANCILNLSCAAGTPSGGGGGGISDIPTTPQAPATPPPLDTSEHSYAVGKNQDANTDFKFVFAQYQRTSDEGVSAKIGYETLTKTGDNGRSFGFDIATAQGTLSSTNANGTASVLKASYGQDVGRVPVKVTVNVVGVEGNVGFKADAKGFEAGLSSSFDAASVKVQAGKLDPTKQGDLRVGVKAGFGLGAKFKLGVKDEDADGYPEVHLAIGLGLGGALEGSLVYESTDRTAPYLRGLLNIVGGKKKP